MKYDELYKTFKKEIPEGFSFLKIKEKESEISSILKIIMPGYIGKIKKIKTIVLEKVSNTR